MKRTLAIILAIMIIFPLTGCGIEGLISGLSEGTPSGVTNTKNPSLIGTWELVIEDEASTDGGESEAALSDIDFGLGIEFTKDGKLRYGFDSESLESIAGGTDVNDLLGGMEMLMTIYYEVKSDTELEMTISALMGMKTETQTVEYSLNGDTLVFDGATYTRVK